MAVVQIDSSTIEVDGAHPFVASQGPWIETIFTGLGLFNDTVSYTGTAGSRKIVRFIGTSITVQGGLQGYTGTPNSPLVIQGSVDDGRPSTYSPPSPPNYEVVIYYQSPILPMGEHVLTVQNMVTRDITHLDSFIIHAAGGQTPQILPSDGSSVPRSQSQAPIPPIPPPSDSTPSTTTSATTLGSTASSKSNLPPDTSKPILPSTDQSSFSATPLSSMGNTITPSTAPLASASVPTQSTLTTDTVGVGLEGRPSNRAVIASSICGSLFVIALIVLALFLRHKRRRRRTPEVLEPYLESQQVLHPRANVAVSLVEAPGATPEKGTPLTSPRESVTSNKLPNNRRAIQPTLDAPQLPPYEP